MPKEMERSERTKRRKIAAKVAEHFRHVSQESEFHPPLELQFGSAPEDSTEGGDYVYTDCV